jgi:hypothetical protein
VDRYTATSGESVVGTCGVLDNGRVVGITTCAGACHGARNSLGQTGNEYQSTEGSKEAEHDKG